MKNPIQLKTTKPTKVLGMFLKTRGAEIDSNGDPIIDMKHYLLCQEIKTGKWIIDPHFMMSMDDFKLN